MKRENGDGGYKLWRWACLIAYSVVIALAINKYVIINSVVPSWSMEPTIMTGSRVIGSRLHYRFGEPERGDIAIFVYGWSCPVCGKQVEGEQAYTCPFCKSMVNSSDKINTVYFLKRVIGVPGDIIDIIDNKIYLNHSDTALAEPYLKEPMNKSETYHFEVPEGCYLMLGDNRNNSNDSRYWNETYITKDKVVAKAVFQYHPFFKKF